MHSLQALYGGTFDPVHYGHLKPVEILANLIGLQRVIIMPNNVPPHRPQPEASSEQRKEMLTLAIADKPLFSLDERELRRDTPSGRRKRCRSGEPSKGRTRRWPLLLVRTPCSIFPRHQYETILENSHLLVCRRPGYPLTMREEQYQQWLEAHLTDNIEELHNQPAGKIYLAETPWFDISATLIRERLQQGLACDDLLPSAVLDYIHAHGLYQKSADA